MEVYFRRTTKTRGFLKKKNVIIIQLGALLFKTSTATGKVTHLFSINVQSTNFIINSHKIESARTWEIPPTMLSYHF